MRPFCDFFKHCDVKKSLSQIVEVKLLFSSVNQSHSTKAILTPTEQQLESTTHQIVTGEINIGNAAIGKAKGELTLF